MTQSIMERLHDEMWELHEQLADLPYFLALAAEKAELISYVGHLRALAIVHAAVDYELPRVDHPAVASVWRAELAATELLERDSDFFRARLIPDIPSAIDEALGIATRIRRRRIEDPVSLLGYVYVLAGSTLGAPTVKAQAARAFGLEAAAGLAYLAGREAAAEKWTSFSAQMNAAIGDEASQARVVAAARELFAGLQGVFQGLYPVTATRFMGAGLNPEAGSHPVTQDPRELQAALRAGEACWREFPYYEHRFGARGKRFTRGDSAWLATLVTLDPDRVSHQVRWLGGVLAARGMPRLLLQRQLEILARELGEEVPERRASYEKLTTAARELAEARNAAIPGTRAVALAAEFEASIDPDEAARIARVGELLVAAIQDERAGVVGAVESLERWLTEPSRFSPAWIAAVRATLSAARASV